MKPTIILFLLVTLLQSMMSQGQMDDLMEFGKEGIEKLKKKELRAADEIEPIKGAAGKAAAKVSQFLNSNPYLRTVGFFAQEQLLDIEGVGELGITTPRPAGATPRPAQRPPRPLLFSDARIARKIVTFKPCFKGRYFSDTPLPFPGPNQTSCCPIPTITCRKSKYRTVDGSCNCEDNPHMGRSLRAMRRLLPPDYFDGIHAPRNESVKGNPLPSPRKVSIEIFQSRPDRVNSVLTQLHMIVGQFLDHDSDKVPVVMFLTKKGKLVNPSCGETGCKTSGSRNAECFPIKIPKGDPFFNSSECISAVRSQIFPTDNCRIGPAEQPNALTSWLDASMVYGSSKYELDKLRLFDEIRGKMNMSTNKKQSHCKPLLPALDKPKSKCREGTKCFLAGDERVNEQVSLTAVHTIFMRLHNHFEGKLFKVFRQKGIFESGEMLFQETRKLLIAVWQNIVYHEYLPLTIGQKWMNKFKLTLKDECFKRYNCTKYNADVPNVFAAAAFRFGHSQIGNSLWVSNPKFTKKKAIPFTEVMHRPFLIYRTDLPGEKATGVNSTCGVDSIMLGVSSNQADTVDRFFTEQITKHLFAKNPPNGIGTDLPARNIQRGRDHGIPGYTKWRKFCNLTVPKNFFDMDDIPGSVRGKLSTLYDDVRDIDLYTAGIAEEVVKGGTVGPTFACIIANRFKSAKFADRFWFERCNTETGFTEAQIASIKKYTFGRLLCDTLDNVRTIQKFPMMVSLSQATQKLGLGVKDIKAMFPLFAESSNKRVKCSELPEINFNLWGRKGKKKKP